MSNDLKTKEAESVVAFIPPAPVANLPAVRTDEIVASMMGVMERVATNPNFNGDNAAQFFALVKEQNAKMAEQSFNRALAEVQRNAARVPRNGRIKTGQGSIPYMKNVDIDAAVRPLLSANGLTLTHSQEMNGGMVRTTTTLRHVDGHSESTTCTLPVEEGNKAKDATKCAVSTYTFGRRVNTIALLNIVADEEADYPEDAGAAPKQEVEEIKALIARAGFTEERVKAALDKNFGVQRIEDLGTASCAQFKSLIIERAAKEGKAL